MKCSYGCGQEGKHQFTNGKWCCEAMFSKCPEVRRKNSEGCKKAHEKNPEKYNGHANWSKGLTEETDSRIKKRTNTRRQSKSEGKEYWRGKHLPQEMKDKISKSRIKYLENNPDKVPYKLNHYSKGMSYPEKYFEEVFKKENIDLKYEKQFSIYTLDFYNDEKKVCIEIDGEQHYTDTRIIESNKRRDLYLKKQGWITFRVRWSEYQKMNDQEKALIINQIRELCNRASSLSLVISTTLIM